ncbi:BspA family leucine-rich repeat surface protein [Companilactobacillus huachuanensis]|uniref:BspA family leucine-rich repeat surface protein n=1 Tax=Companilactobacillus huachuanensis TaxID=2559914 RepID=A0ABW1RQS1_9LACO|nr:BspA family leucine-rich repeat surface protein [Companilactobacillus huachuanensis]
MKKANLSSKQKYALKLIVFLCGALLPLFSAQVVDADTNDIQNIISQNKIVTDDNNSTSTIMPLIATTAADPTDIASGTFGTCDWVIDASGKLTISKPEGSSSGVLGIVHTENNVILDLPWYDYRSQITSVYVGEGVIGSYDTSLIFANMPNVTTIDVSNLDVQFATTFTSMFVYDPKLISIIGLGNWNLSKANSLINLFSGDSLLSQTDGIEKWNMKNVTDISGMFNSDKNINIEGLENWDTSNIINMNSLFYSTNITDFSPIENWDVSKVIGMNSLFEYNSSVTSIDLSKWKTNSLGSIARMFSGCSGLTDIKGLDTLDVSNVSSMSYTFNSDQKITSLEDVKDWNTSNVLIMTGTFSNCLKLSDLDLRNWDTSKVGDMSYMFRSDIGLNEKTLKGLDKIKTDNVTNMNNMFSGTGFTTLDLENFNTAKVTDIGSMFSDTKSLQQINGEFDTGAVTDMSNVFLKSNISNFDGLNISKWNLSKVTSMSGMFWGDAAKSLDFISNWDTSNVKSFYAIFNAMSNLEALDLTNFDTTNATDVQYMLGGGNPKLWKISLGPKTVLTNLSGPEQSASVGLDRPVAGTIISDSSTNTGETYKAISDKWQEVDVANGGTDHAPLGDLNSSKDIINKFSTVGNPVTTYVWQQQPKINMNMSVPDIDFGTTSNASGLVRRKNEFSIDVTNNSYPTDPIPSTVDVSMDAPLTDKTDPSKTLKDVLIFKNSDDSEKILSATDTEIYSGNINDGENVLSWDDDHGILLDMNNDRYAENGDYSTTLKWTLTNSL